MIKLCSTPAVSCILFPASSPESGTSTRLHLSTSLDYSTGKLFRTGLDGVYGLDGNRREYNPSRVRQNLTDIDEHKRTVPNVVAMQGNGNIGLNNWAIAFLEVDGSPTLIVPAGEVLHERVYPCFIAARSDDGTECYTIQHVMIFRDPDIAPQDRERLTWEGIEERKLIVNRPDREMHGDTVFLPIWNEQLRNVTVSLDLKRPDSPIDWNETNRVSLVEFVELSRFDSDLPSPVKGGINGHGLLILPVELGPSETVGKNVIRFKEPIKNVRFAFFGIPCRSLLNGSHSGGSPLNPILHYFYDLRHVFDLGSIECSVTPSSTGTATASGRIEFYLFEWALKANTFEKAKGLLRALHNGTQLCPLQIDIAALRDAANADSASCEVITMLDNLKTSGSAVDNALQARGYRKKSTRSDVKDPGDFYCEPASDGISGIIVLPQRNVYSYSFIGCVHDQCDDQYVVLAVVGGQGGIRPSRLPDVIQAPLRSAITLEEAVDAINAQLTKAFGREWEWRNDDELLLLDQGGDVHQDVNSGGIGYTVGSSMDRKKISAELLLAINKT